MLYCISARRRAFPSYDYSWFGFIGSLFFEKIILSYLSAISMPTDFDRTNLLIIKRTISRSNFNENDKSDTSCNREMKIS